MLPPVVSRPLAWTLIVAAGCSLSGCGGQRHRLRAAQHQTMQIYQQSQALAGQLGEAQMLAGQLSAENQQLAANLDVANQRIANLASERSQLHDQYKSLLTGLKPGENPLGGAASRKFEELARKYPEFEFDPTTGVSRFNGDLLFATGSDEVRDKGRTLLQEFSRIMNDPDARQFHVLVVGHTDDQPIVKAATRAAHQTNWDLSVHRATAVVKTLAKLGIDEQRMGAAGYSMFQQTAANVDATSRQQNRRVEIFVLAPDATIAGWDPGTRR
ncbi:MAG: OmpA family protein [Planctomyces sp.]|nr:OmpA family protein [Planctomyces sp.]